MSRRKNSYASFGKGVDTLESWSFEELKRAVQLPEDLLEWESTPYRKDQAKRVLLGAARELRLAALRVIAEQMRHVARRGSPSWAGSSYSPALRNRVLFLLEQLSSEQLPQPTGGLVWQQRFAIEELVLNVFADECFERTLYGDSFGREYFHVFQRIWECTIALPEKRYSPTREFVELYDMFWRRFVDKSKAPPLGAHMEMLLRKRAYSNTSEEFSEELKEFIDSVCAWLIRDEKNDDLLHYIRRYGFSQTRHVLERRFWKMLLRAAELSVTDDEDRTAFMKMPVQWVFGNTEACKHISNRVVTSWCVMTSRSIDGAVREPFEVPQWVKRTKVWLEFEKCVETYT
ncbi:MAG: hypothetical protein U9M98_01880 [Patescibacteria group bacterium]|nr:hypothetical protein [Patescibacteria group bacterium]